MAVRQDFSVRHSGGFHGRRQPDSIPYRDLFDHKQPLIYSFYWLAWVIGPYSTLTIRIIAALVAGGALILPFLVIRQNFSSEATLAFLFLGSAAGASRFIQGADLNTEHLLALTASMAVLAPFVIGTKERAWPSFVVGFLVSLAVLSKAVGGFVAPAALLPLLLFRRSRGEHLLKTLALFTLGAVTPILGLILFYAASGAVDDFVYANLIYNVRYIQESRYIYADQTLWGHLWTAPSPSGLPAIQILSFGALVLGVAKVAAYKGRNLFAWATLLWLIGAIVATKVGKADHPHYFVPQIIPASLLLALPTSTKTRRTPISVLSLAPALLITFPFLSLNMSDLGTSPYEVTRRTYGSEVRKWSVQDEVGEWLRENADPSDTLFVTGAEPGFYWQSGLRSVTKYIYDYPYSVDPPLAEGVKRVLEQNPPDYYIHEEGVPLFPYFYPLEILPYTPVAKFGPMIIYRLER